MNANRAAPGVMPVPTEPTKRYGTPLGYAYAVIIYTVMFLALVIGKFLTVNLYSLIQIRFCRSVQP